MLNLEKICKVWDNLDHAYETMHSNGQSKRDFLNQVVGYRKDSNVTAIDYLEERLLEEAKSYNEEQNTKYRDLLEKFRAVKTSYDSNFESDIESLNEFITDNVNYDKLGYSKINQSFLSKIQLKEIKIPNKPLTMNLAEAYDLTDQFGSCTVKKQGMFKTVEVEDEDAFLFDGTLRTTRILFNKDIDCKLRPAVGKYLKDLINELGTDQIEETYLFLTEKYYEISKSRIYLKIGSCKKYASLNSVKVGDGSYTFEKVINGVKYNIVCFLPK